MPAPTSSNSSPDFTPARWRIVLAKAKRRHLLVAGHIPATVSALDAARGGQRTAEHLLQLSEACSAREGKILAARQPLPSASLRTELQLFVEYGPHPRRRPPHGHPHANEFLGAGDRRGTVAVGKAADPVLLDADPLADIRHTERIRALILGGRLLDREASND